MAKKNSISVVLCATFVAAIVGYSWGVYTQVNPEYDNGIREHFSPSTQEIVTYDDGNYPLRKVTMNHKIGIQEHGSAEEFNTLLATVKDNTVEVLSENISSYEVFINDLSVGTFQGNTFSLPIDKITNTMHIKVVSDDGLVANAYISN